MISFLDKNGVEKENLDDDCYFDTFNNAASIKSSSSKRFASHKKLVYTVNVIPLRSLIKNIPIKKIKEIILNLDSIEDLL